MARLIWLLFFCSIAALASEPTSQPAVLVPRPIVILVRRFQLPQRCGTKTPIDACTAFVGQELFTECRAVAGEWRIDARAQFIPVMYVLDGEHVHHENEHVDDIRVALRKNILELEEQRFPDAQRCAVEAAVAARGFRDAMDRLKLESNRRRHSSVVTFAEIDRPARHR